MYLLTNMRLQVKCTQWQENTVSPIDSNTQLPSVIWQRSNSLFKSAYSGGKSIYTLGGSSDW